MDTKHLVDPELLAALEFMPPFDLSVEMLPQMRGMMVEMLRQQREAAPPSDIIVEERHIPGQAGAPDVRVVIYSPPATYSTSDRPGPKPGYLHIHGGGYVMGSPEMFDMQSKAVVREIGCVVVSVDYRLAPETPHPGPVEDCYAALKWFYTNAASLSVDASRIAIGGESAGGGLTAALGLLARDRGEVPIVFQLLIYPMLDDRTVTRSDPHPFAGEFIWNARSNHFGWHSLLSQEPGSPGVSPYAAAARADDLAGLPPTFISVGALDIFLDEDIDYGQRLLRAGVPTELHVYPGAYHGFDLAFDAEVTKQFRRDAVQALKRALIRT
ncbi:MAG: alpha/beta hydrolase [Rhodospirillales bacterium]|nr:alpha/beta hydrolase [Rhodospirillales bacterium]